jgi:hypothetical protein
LREGRESGIIVQRAAAQKIAYFGDRSRAGDAGGNDPCLQDAAAGPESGLNGWLFLVGGCIGPRYGSQESGQSRSACEQGTPQLSRGSTPQFV